ncbi:MAG TPA: PHP-associated domain-containing protein [Candidatus Thermoplasmatota archaeon]|nr:PHP-associated domain-containing protein [Candidatus Thermoplasmatota archaeon]
MLKLDLHLHSCYSDDGVGSPEDIIQALRRRGLNGMALTDHNTIEGSLKARRVAPADFIVIPSIEITTADGHLLAFNVSSAIQPGLPLEETVEQVMDAGGIPVVPHLLRLLSGIKQSNLDKIRGKLSAIEVFNGCSTPRTNLKMAKAARAMNLGGTGGSDSHNPLYAGFSYTLVDTTDARLDTVLSEIQKKKTWGEGVIMPLSYRRDRMITSVKQFVQRGFHRI